MVNEQESRGFTGMQSALRTAECWLARQLGRLMSSNAMDPGSTIIPLFLYDVLS